MLVLPSPPCLCALGSRDLVMIILFLYDGFEVPGKSLSHAPFCSFAVTIIRPVAPPRSFAEKSPQSPTVTEPYLVVAAFKPSKLGNKLLVSGLKKLFLA